MLGCKSQEEQEKLINFVGMQYEIVKRENKLIHTRIRRKCGGLCTYGMGKTLFASLESAMVGQPIDWNSAKRKMNDEERKMNDEEWLAVCHL